jgi:Periplasmic lysozyme inhibitor of I-type lysozyme
MLHAYRNLLRAFAAIRAGLTMNRRWQVCIATVLVSNPAVGANVSSRVVKQAVMPGASTIVVVAEGDFEPRSMGSYSVRAYTAANPRFPFDDFIAGTLRPRDGAIEAIKFSDLDRDGSRDVIVISRSTGTGSYVSADAFRLSAKQLTLLESVSNLAKNADPVRALESKLSRRTKPNPAPEADKPRQ